MRLRIPIALAFTLAGCGDDGGTCFPGKGEICVQSPIDTTPCPENTCVDSNGNCPTGCVAEHQKLFCVPDGTDAGVCPNPAPCILAGMSCPAGCTPVG